MVDEFNYVSATVKNDEVHVWIRDKNHQLEKIVTNIPYYLYVKDNKGSLQDILGDKASYREFDSYQDMMNFSKRNVGMTYEADISPLHKFLSDNFHDAPNTPVHIGFYDIEVNFDLNDGKGYPTPDNPFGEVNSISLYDAHKQEYSIIMLNDDKSITVTDTYDNIHVNNYHCVTERQVLDTFAHIIKDIDILTAWNGEFFDLPYLIARYKRFYGDIKGRKALCRNGKHDNFIASIKKGRDQFGNEYDEYLLKGRSHIDMLRVYQKFVLEGKDSYALDNISEDELGMKKVSYDGDLGELYRTDPQKFFEYSLHDVRLLKYLEEKKRLLSLLITMARSATVEFREMFGSIRHIEMAIRNYAHFERQSVLILPNKKDQEKDGKFPGALVYNPKPGVYGWAMSIDLASLYPSTIRAINISPETHIYQCLNYNADFVNVVSELNVDISVLDVRSGEVDVVNAKELHQIMLEAGWSISANGSIFTNDFVGLIPEVLGVWYKQRQQLKAKAKECNAVGDKEGYDYYDMLQGVRKIQLNSVYGALGNPYCRFFTLDCAKSTTLTGQEISKFQVMKTDKYLKEVSNVS